MIALLACCCSDTNFIDYKWIVSNGFFVVGTHGGGTFPSGYVSGQGGFSGGSFEDFRNYVLNSHTSGIYSSSLMPSIVQHLILLDEYIYNSTWGFTMSNGNGTYSTCHLNISENYSYKSCCL